MAEGRDTRPLFSVVICTRDRAGSLERTLTSLVEAKLASTVTWELIVVDNGSADETQEVLRRYTARLPLRGVFEPQAGLSFARNRGMEVASGGHIIWTDDDVTVDEGFLLAYVEAFSRYPEAGFFGGTIRPVLESPTPNWLPPNRKLLGYLLAERSPTEPTEILPGTTELPFGANFAVRSDLQRRFPYDTDLGASPQFNRLGEEEQVMKRMLQSGEFGRWTPSAIVNHHIPAARQTLTYIAKYNRAVGETWAHMASEGRDGASFRSRMRVAGMPTWVLRMLIVDYLLYQFYRLLGQPTRWLPRLTTYAYCRGAVGYLLRQSRRAP